VKYEPYEYQKTATRFIEDNIASALLIDMGLGKTVITLTAINDLLFDSFLVKKVLVVAPLRVARYTWPNEIKKWDHLKNMKYSLITGDKKRREAAVEQEADVYIINRENLQWLVENYKFDYGMVVVDELSSFKNHKAKRFKALMSVRRNIKRIVGLTGTPAGNGYMDLFAEYKLLDFGERLGRYITAYRNMYFEPDKRGKDQIYTYKLKPFMEERILQKINDITISMKAEDYLNMPEKINNAYKVYLDADAKSKYLDLKKELVLSMKGKDITVANAATLVTKLSQMANGAIYTDEGDVEDIHDHKLDALEDLIESANGKPVLVAYWYKHDLRRIRMRLEKLDVVYQNLDSDKSISDWNEGKIQVGLIHPASAGHGLNLQHGGNIIIWYGLTWSLELYQQTNARLYRQGQKEKTVVIYHIIAEDTIDERIMRVLEGKESTQDMLLEALKLEVS